MKKPFIFKSLWENAKGRIIIFSVFIASLATFLANTQTVIDFFRNLFSNKNEGVQIVDASFNNFDTLNNEDDILDIKVRNIGNEIAIVKKIRLDIKQQWIISPFIVNHGALKASALYNLAIDCKRAPPYALEGAISQEIEPNKSDRFLIRLGKKDRHLQETYFYLADLTLIYDENDKISKKQNYIFAFFCPNAFYSGKLTLKDKASKDSLNYLLGKPVYLDNLKPIEQIKKTDAIKSNQVIDFLNEFDTEVLGFPFPEN